MTGREVLVILNPIAGGARGTATGEKICELLTGDGLRPTLHVTEGPGDAKIAAASAVDEGFECVAVAGGDGTVGEAVSALLGTRTAMGIVPLGTANALGRELGLPLEDPSAACRIIGENCIREVDVGVCNGQPFAIMCGVGLDAEVALRTHQGRWKGRLGKWAFIGQFLRTVCRERPRRFRVTVDGQCIEEDLWAVVACNGSQYTWRLSFAPEARLDDGVLHVVLFRQRGRARLLVNVARSWLSRARHEVANTTILRGRQVRVEAQPPIRWQTDGDARGMTPVEIALRPGALRLIVGKG